MKDKEEFITLVYDNAFCQGNDDCLWAIIDKTALDGEAKTGKFAGVVSLNDTSTTNGFTELGIIVFPEFHHTHIATNAIGLALMRTLDPPSVGGMGLRRVEWRTHSGNEASRKIASRMGFELEGIMRWHKAFANEELGVPVGELEKRNGTKGEIPGRHTALYSLVWDEWDEKRPKVVELMARKA